MTPQVFRDKTIQAAITRVKEKLGGDAMILSTRRVPKSPRDPYGRDLFEIEAAPKGSCPESPPSKRKEPGSEETYSLREELAGIKDLISLTGLGSGMQEMVMNHPESTRLFASLLRCGISDSLAQSLLKRACRSLDRTEKRERKGPGSLKKYLILECMEGLGTRDPFKVESGDGMPHVAAFVGPTGVGKTTTIAKLAAELSLNRGRKVGLISIDNYRIGALEQLKTYGAIMGLPCIPAFNKEDLGRALNRMRTLDVVLVDTAGHSHRDREKMAEVTALLKEDIRVSTHLVLSLTTGRMEMKEAARAFSGLHPETYVFTKVDETRQCGKILDQISDLALPVSMITNGQKVPEDLVVPDTRELLGIMLGTEQ